MPMFAPAHTMCIKRVVSLSAIVQYLKAVKWEPEGITCARCRAATSPSTPRFPFRSGAVASMAVACCSPSTLVRCCWAGLSCCWLWDAC